MAASQTMPSCISPSPSKAYTFHGALSNFEAIAIPQAAENPCPNDPVDISTPGVPFISGCPCNILPIFLSPFNSSLSK